MSERAPGFEEYSPSRLEWFAVLLNSFSNESFLKLTLMGRVDETIIKH